MKFDELNAEYVGLRNALRAFVGENALSEITVQPPVGDDEASFLRLTAWSYALIFEAGRVAIPYLLKLPASPNPSASDAESARRMIGDLRASSFHNLELSSSRNSAMYRRTSLWFMENCGANPPSDAVCWRDCFECLCDMVGMVLARCKSALETALANAEGGGGIIDDLKRRIDRNWPAHEFDKIAGDAAIRIGQSIDVPKFREKKLAEWRDFLYTVSEGEDLEDQITRVIERDILDIFEFALPIDGRDVMEILGLHPGPRVGEALLFARQLRSSGITTRAEIIERLIAEYRPGETP